MKGKIGFRSKNIHWVLFVYGNETAWTVVELLTNVHGLKVEIRMYLDAKAGNAEIFIVAMNTLAWLFKVQTGD